MTSRFLSPVFQALDGKGKALPGAKLDFFEVGSSTTRKDTFSDESLSVENSNPVLADGAGVFPNIYGIGSYRVVLQDRTGIQEWERGNVIWTDGSLSINGGITLQEAIAIDFSLGDPVTTIGYTTVNDGGGSDYIVVAGGTGTDDGGSHIDMDNGLQIELILAGDLNVKQFGITGDGTSDDTTAWLSLANFLTTNSISVIGNSEDNYKTTADVRIEADFDFDGRGASFMPVGANGVIVGKTQLGVFATVTADLEINTDFATVDSTGNFQVGDIVKILSTENWMLDPTPSEDMRKGAVNKINRISGNVMFFEKLLTDNYESTIETVTITKLDKVTVNMRNFSVLFGDSEPRVGVQIEADDGGVITNVKISKAQIQGVNVARCYKTMLTGNGVHEANNTGTGYGMQLNDCTDVKVHHNHFTGCRRGVDISGQVPSRGCDIAFNDADGSGLDSAGGNMPSNSGSSGFGSHETSEFNSYRQNKVSGCKFGILLRGKDELVQGNYFYQDINIACVQASKSINYTIYGNHYASGLRPGKTLVAGDEQQKTPQFVSFTNPAVDGGFYKIMNNTFDDLKNAFMTFNLTVNAPFTTLTNLTITGNSGTVQGTGSGTVFFLDQADQVVTIQDSFIINNDIRKGITSFEMYDPDLDIDYQGSVDIDNLHFGILDDILISGGGGTLTRQRFDMNMNIKNGEVNITGFVEFDITDSPVNVKMQNLPTKSVTGGSYGPAYGFPYVGDVTTTSVGNHGMIAMPAGTSGSIPTSAWVSFDLLAYNTPFPVANGYKVPLVFKYYTERRRV